MNKTNSDFDCFTRLAEEWDLSPDAQDNKLTHLSLAGLAAGRYLSTLEGFSGYNPYHPESSSQGLLECIYELQEMSCSMSGLAAASLVSSCGSQAIFGCLSMIKKYHQRKKQSRNTLLLCDDFLQVTVAAEQTNLQIKNVSINQLEQNLNSTVAAIVVSIPDIKNDDFLPETVCEKIKQLDVIVYMEGTGQYFYPLQSMPQNMAIDLLSLDLGYLCESGSGAYAVLSNEKLKSFLPAPRVQLVDHKFSLQTHQQNPFSIGALNTGIGDIEQLLRCYTQLRLKGAGGLQQLALKAIVAALYVIKKLTDKGLGSACSTIGNTGACRITVVNPVASISSLLQHLADFKSSGLQIGNLNIDGGIVNDELPVEIILGRLHYLSKTQLDSIIEILVENL